MMETRQANNWYVITGAPCCGKTTTVHMLASRGYRTTIEEARHYLSTQRRHGRAVTDVRHDPREFQLAVLQLQIAQEEALPRDEVVFLDRAIPDARAYYRFLGLEEDPLLQTAIANASYKKVFILERLPLVHDYARQENEEAQLRLEQLVNDVYTELGFPIVRIPVMFPEERVDLILANL